MTAAIIHAVDAPGPVRLAYLTFDDVGNPVLNIQDKGEPVLWKIQISFGHLANIVADGAEALAELAMVSL